VTCANKKRGKKLALMREYSMERKKLGKQPSSSNVKRHHHALKYTMDNNAHRLLQCVMGFFCQTLEKMK